jgi:hypothetical protein
VDNQRHEKVHDQDFREETAAEIAPKHFSEVSDSSLHAVQEGEGSGTALGITGLVFSLISLFTLPFLLSFIGMGAGFFAYRRGARSLGRWAIGIGIVAFIGALVFAPFLG